MNILQISNSTPRTGHTVPAKFQCYYRRPGVTPPSQLFYSEIVFFLSFMFLPSSLVCFQRSGLCSLYLFIYLCFSFWPKIVKIQQRNNNELYKQFFPSIQNR